MIVATLRVFCPPHEVSVRVNGEQLCAEVSNDDFRILLGNVRISDRKKMDRVVGLVQRLFCKLGSQ